MLVAANIFQPLIDVFEAVLKFFHNSGGFTWGWSIVALTFLVRLVLLPLAVTQFHSMQRLQRVAPQLKAVQAKYKDDKQRQHQEIMKLYSEHGVNPLASCLPMVAQLPVFLGLYFTLRKNLRPDICPAVQRAYQQTYAMAHHVSLHAAAGHTTPCLNPTYSHLPHSGAGFLFINDLTNKATGAALIVLIVLYVGSQMGYTLLMSAPTMDKTQRNLMMFLPLIFVAIIINFPAGLIMYWVTTNLLMILQQYVIRRRVGPMAPLATPVGSPPATSDTEADSNGAADGGGGIGGLLRGRLKAEDKEPAGVGARGARREAAPPPPPRKKKKRSGRRR
jgi:YidC/Oxa1 family membrane protein insertase